MSTPLLIKRKSPVVTLTLNRPGVANAVNRELTDALAAAVTAVTADPTIQVLVLEGAGSGFCGGGDLQAMTDADLPEKYLRSMADDMHAILLGLARSHLTVIGVVDGPAAGAGLGIALNCDFLLATPSASFVPAYGRVGLTPDCGVSYLLPRIVGPRRARRMLLLNERLDAARALDWGMVDAVVEPEEVSERVDELAGRLLEGVERATTETKRLSSTIDLDDYQRHLADEAQTIAAMLVHPDSSRRVHDFAVRSSRAPVRTD
ncbi:enoyl-CoA hydratase/isomerase family protein [Actinomycetes bacterium M1A6_2h]